MDHSKMGGRQVGCLRTNFSLEPPSMCALSALVHHCRWRGYTISSSPLPPSNLSLPVLALCHTPRLSQKRTRTAASCLVLVVDFFVRRFTNRLCLPACLRPPMSPRPGVAAAWLACPLSSALSPEPRLPALRRELRALFAVNRAR